MPGALFSRIKTWVSTEDVSYSDLNTEFNNILQNLVPLMIDDYSVNATQMKVKTDPGEVGTESLATTLGGELARIRFLLSEITGESEWYESPTASLLGLANAIGTGMTDNRIVSGKVRTTSDQPLFLKANGAAKTVTVSAATTNFIYYVNGTEYTMITDVDLAGLTAAPTSNNTCLVNDALATGGEYWTKHAGEDGSEINVDTMGSEISGLTGKFGAFKLAGAATEYFIAYVKSATVLSKASRGFFFDSSNAPVARTTFTNNDTITLMKLTWVFAKTDGTLTATYNNPVWSKDEPGSPALGDYWYDIPNNTWKVYGVGSYSSAGAHLIGCCIQDGTNTVAARSFEFFKGFAADNTIELFYNSATSVQSRWPGSNISVWGTSIKFDKNLVSWDITADLDSGVTEAASTYYYFYITETGDKVISNVKPHDRREDLLGYYHPHNPWSCVGRAFNNSSSDLEQVESYFRRSGEVQVRSIISTDISYGTKSFNLFSGATKAHYLPPAALTKGQSFIFKHNGTSLTQVYTITTFGAETIAHGGTAATTFELWTNGESVTLYSDGTGYNASEHYSSTSMVSYTPTGAWSSNVTYTGAWQRRGQTLCCQVVVTCSGAPTSASLTFSLPSGAVIDTALLLSAAAARPLPATAGLSLNAGAALYPSYAGYSSTTAVMAGCEVADTYVSVTQAVPFTFGNTDLVSLYFEVPIVGWKP